MTERKLHREARVAINLVDPDVPPDEDAKNERIDVERTLEARRMLADAAEKEHRPHNLPLLARSAHALWNPRVDVSDVRAPSKDEVEAVNGSRCDTVGAFTICLQCVRYFHEEGQRLLWQQGLAERYQEALGAAGVERLGDLREYGYCEATDNLCHPHRPSCPSFVDRSKTLGRLIGGARGFWRRVGGF